MQYGASINANILAVFLKNLYIYIYIYVCVCVCDGLRQFRTNSFVNNSSILNQKK